MGLCASPRGKKDDKSVLREVGVRECMAALLCYFVSVISTSSIFFCSGKDFV